MQHGSDADEQVAEQDRALPAELHGEEGGAEGHYAGCEVVRRGDERDGVGALRVADGVSELGCFLEAAQDSGVVAVEHEGGAAGCAHGFVEGFAL